MRKPRRSPRIERSRHSAEPAVTSHKTSSTRASLVIPALIRRNRERLMVRSRAGLTSKIHVVIHTSGLPVRLALPPGGAHDDPPCLSLGRLHHPLHRSGSVSTTRKAIHESSSPSILHWRIALARDARHFASSPGSAWRTWMSATPSHSGRPLLANTMRSSRKTRSRTRRSASAPLSAWKAAMPRPLISAT